MATSKIITMHRGDTYPITVTVRDAATHQAQDITGCSFMLTVSAEQNPEDSTNQVFQVAGALDADPTTGRVAFTPTATDTNQPPGTYYYDVQMTDADSNIRTIVKDKFILTMDITK